MGCRWYLAVVVAVVVLGTVVDAWPWSSGPKYCQYELDAKVVQSCHPHWIDIACGGCRKKRETDLDDFVMDEQTAKAYLQVSLSRKRRSLPGLKEECCNEGCRDEEVEEHC